jgi:hypothetical protein
VDETAWATAKNPHHLMRLSRIRPSGRKYLLLACALVRRLHIGAPPPLGLRVLDAAERFAVAQPRKGIKTHIWREVVRPAVPELPDPHPPRQTMGAGSWLPLLAGRLGTLSTVNYADINAVLAVLMARVEQRARDDAWNERLKHLFIGGTYSERFAERVTAATATACDTIREVFADPLRPPAFDPGWLLCNHGAARHIAEGIQASGNFAELPILADALEDAGCRDAALLAHCREAKEHAPGCWALDLVLGKG